METQHQYRRTHKLELTVGGESSTHSSQSRVRKRLPTVSGYSTLTITLLLVASGSLGSDHFRLFGPVEVGETSILAPQKARNGIPR